MKRRKSKDNPYIIKSDNENNIYSITFYDINLKKQNLPISKKLYDTFNTFELEDLSYLNKYDRHIEHYPVNEIKLNKKSNIKNIDLEQQVIKKIEYDNLYNAIKKLPDIQKKRIKMYYFQEKSQQEIANYEKCSLRAIQYSLKCGIENLKKYLK